MNNLKWENFSWIAAMFGAVIGTSTGRAATPVSTAFTYQGEVRENGVPVNQNSDFQFSLWDAQSNGSQIGVTQQIDDHPVARGRFTVELDFGSEFDGDARFLEVSVRSPHDSSDTNAFTTLSPRQSLTPAPYALYALNAAGASDYWTLNGTRLTNSSGDFVGINRDTPVTSKEYFGVQAPVQSGYGGMYIATDGDDGLPFYGYAAGPSAAWHYLDGTNGKWHLYNNGNRVTVDDTGNVGIGTENPLYRLHVETNSGHAILGQDNAGGCGLLGQSVNGTGVFGMGIGASANGVRGETVDVNGIAVLGIHNNPQGADPAIRGETHSLSSGAIGVHGRAVGTNDNTASNYGVLGESDSWAGVGVHGRATAVSGTTFGVQGETNSSTGYAAYFTGPSGSRSYFERRVGIGTLNPTSKLHVEGDVRIDGGNRLRMFDGALETVRLGASGSGGGGFLSLRNSNEIPLIELDSDENDQPAFRMNRDDGTPTGVVNIQMIASDTDDAPTIQLLDNGAERVRLDGRGNGGGGGISLFNQVDEYTAEIDSNDGSGGAVLRLGNDIGAWTIELLAMETNTEGAAVKFYNANGDPTIMLDADKNGVGSVITNQVEITGADLAERIPASEALAPGMVVQIDPNNPGRICLSRSAYNRRVAGIVSGANDFATGAVLGNLPGNEKAPPIALSGRVYVWCDASGGPVEAGDLLTTSATPGHAMKVVDHHQAQGAIIGKAMTGLSEGKGLVLALVSLQ